ncbi:unnamed protein product, partial [Tilletia caries]
HQQQQTHHHQQTHQHQHATHGHHDPTGAAAGLSASNAHNHAHAHQHTGAASTPTGGPHHAAAYTLGQSSLEDLVAARTHLVEAVNRLSQAYRASYEATEQFQRIVQRASNQALTTFFSTTSSPFVSGDFAMSSFFGLDTTHGAGNGLGSLHSGMVSAAPQPGTTTMQTSYANLAQGNNTTPTTQTAATGTSTGVGTIQPGSASGTIAVANTGEKKGRRSKKDKKERDPNAPKRPPSAYILYQNDVRDDTRSKTPELTYTGVLGKIAVMWKQLSEEERNAYTEKRKRLMSEYTILKKQYHARVTATGGVLKEDSDSDEEDGDDPIAALTNAGDFSSNGIPNRHLGTIGIGHHGLDSPSSVDPQALKKRKVVPSKDAAGEKRAKR